MSNRIKYVYKNGNHVHTVVIKHPEDNNPNAKIYVDGTYLIDIDLISLARQAFEKVKGITHGLE